MRALTKKHEFAGFSFPRYIPEFRKSRYDKRTFRASYVTAGTPVTPKTSTAMFYLDSDFQPFTRWKWCDDVANIKHTGWFCDEYYDSKIRGIVANLPHGKYLAGWSMGGLWHRKLTTVTSTMTRKTLPTPLTAWLNTLRKRKDSIRKNKMK